MDSCFAHHASFLEVSPRSRGKDEPRQGQRPATADRLMGNLRLETSEAARFRSLADGLPSVGFAPVTAPPGKGCHWPAECVTVRFVHAS